MSSTSIPASQLDSTFGCLFLAGIFASVLWGISCLQLFLYYEKYWKVDQLWLKSYVFLIWIFDTVHQILLVYSTYVYFVRGIADPTLLMHLPKTVTNNAILTAVIDAMVQIIFVRRAWHISNRNRVLTGILCASVLAQFVVTATYFGQIYNFTQLTQFVLVVKTELAMNCITVFTDTLLAVAIIWLLWKSRSGIKKTDSVVNRLIMYTIGSGLVTALWTIVALIGAQVAPHTFIYLLVDLVIPKLYYNCMLASLNARSSLRETLSKEVGGLSIHFRDGPSNTTGRSNDSMDIYGRDTNTKGIECRVDIGNGIQSGPNEGFGKNSLQSIREVMPADKSDISGV